ncbi:Caffeic acid O-methyltransferase [Quillaja saponaria]|uniref:Caffeic acid O-methyltransferase n=1 Tax=Quillaja saponaria TaxID=32244 RepID=A0AAD7KV19_QUISA|nr:Caffeic acid O-methyltransferase [Quillaja saponaria]
MVDRILRLLATHSVVTCTVNDGENGSVQWLYGSTPLSKYFLLDQKEISLAPFLHLFHQKALMDSWYGLKDAVLEGGIPFNKVHGMNAFEYHANDPILNQVFHKAMMSLTTVVMSGVLQNYKGFENLKEVVDVGGGIGITLDMIISKYPGIRGINFDLPHIIQQAQISYPGVKYHKGDMFESIPRAEAILLKGILHDWSDEHCLKILKNCHAALPDDGKLIVIDLLLPEEPEISDAARYITQIDLSMMTINPGGKERTKHEYETLAGSIGFKDVRFEYSACCYWVMEFYK